MAYDPEKHHRRSIRLERYDYAHPGAYFVTICVQDRLCLLGTVVDEVIQLSTAGSMIERIWNELTDRYSGVGLDAFVVMPNHIHGIVLLMDDPAVGASPRGCPPDGPAQGPAPTARMSLPDVVHRFKSLTTARYRHGVYQNGWRPFPGRLWQRNYWERVVRDEGELSRIRTYIAENPLRWHFDRYHPNSQHRVRS